MSAAGSRIRSSADDARYLRPDLIYSVCLFVVAVAAIAFCTNLFWLLWSLNHLIGPGSVAVISRRYGEAVDCPLVMLCHDGNLVWV